MTVKNILVPTDFSAGSAEALRCGFDLAVALGATLHVVHVVENPFAPGAFMEIYTPPPAGYFVEMEQLAQEKLRGLLSADQQTQVRAVMTTRIGVPTTEILDRLNEQPPIDLVVMATHGRGGAARFMMGSVADKLIRSATCPVLTIRGHVPGPGLETEAVPITEAATA